MSEPNPKKVEELLLRLPDHEREAARKMIAQAYHNGWSGVGLWSETFQASRFDLVGNKPDGTFDFLPDATD